MDKENDEDQNDIIEENKVTINSLVITKDDMQKHIKQMKYSKRSEARNIPIQRVKLYPPYIQGAYV